MNIHPTKQTGFSLIELMVVIIIISILVTIAFPVYQGFISKTQINSAYQTLSNLKSRIDLKLYNNEVVTNLEGIGWLSGNSDLIHADPTVTIHTGTGEITLKATIDGNVHTLVRGVEIELFRNVDGGWTCRLIKPSTIEWREHTAPTACLVVNS